MNRDAFSAYRRNAFGPWAFRAERLRLRTGEMLGAAMKRDPWERNFFEIVDAPETRSFFVEAPRGFAKSTCAAAIATERLALRPGHLVLVGAKDEEQARIVLAEVHGFVERDPVLERELTPTRYGVMYDGIGSELRIITADAPGSHGYGAGAFTFVGDELWCWPSRALFDAFFSALAKAPGSQVIALTNSGSIGSSAWELREQHRLSTDPGVRFYAPALEGARPSWLDAAELERQRRILPEKEFRRLHLGDWLAGDDLAFLASAIAACTIDEESAWQHGGAIALGVDLGKAHDYSVVIALDLATGEVRDVWRERGAEFTDVARVVVETRRRWGHGPLLIDETGLGAPVLDLIAEQLGPGFRRLSHRDAGDGGGLRDIGRAVYGFSLGNDVKTRLIRKLQVDLERRRLKIPRRFVALLDELRKFRETYTASGRPQFSNPSGSDNHDDCVIALSLACFAFTDETRSTADPILRKIAHAELRDFGVAVNPLCGGEDGGAFREYRKALRDRARLERKRSLGLVTESEYAIQDTRELPWPGWDEFDAAHVF
ncbi:MAG: hypothetical protein WEF50_11170 [Myxococcota bacterium]